MKLKLLIYILDDNQLDLELMSRALHSDTFEIELFTDPDKFKASLNEDVSMVITDIGIPNFDVCETVERIKQKHEGLYVIVVSGYLDCTMYERLKCSVKSGHL
jgi:DNA-binding NtrC family response regulator